MGDEICHGTETVSAVAIVAAAIQHLAKQGASFIFATHLHQLADITEINELERVRNVHLRVHHNKETGELIYDRNIMPGSGDPIYGLEVARAMGLDSAVLDQAEYFRRKILNIDKELVSTKKSHFNSGIYLDKCQICNAVAEETHHIGFQCHADGKNFIGHYHKNIMANLVPICHKCHMKVHRTKEIRIDGYKETNTGLKLIYEN